MNITQLAQTIKDASVNDIVSVLVDTASLDSEVGTYHEKHIAIARVLVGEGLLEENPWKTNLFRRSMSGEELAKSTIELRSRKTSPSVDDVVSAILDLEVAIGPTTKLDVLLRAAAVEAMRRAGGDQVKAAKLLGIPTFKVALLIKGFEVWGKDWKTYLSPDTSLTPCGRTTPRVLKGPAAVQLYPSVNQTKSKKRRKANRRSK